MLVFANVISRSNWAKLSRMFRISRPIECVVLKCCAIETNEDVAGFERLHDTDEVH